MAQTFRQRIAQAEAMARADMLRFQPEVLSCLLSKNQNMQNVDDFPHNTGKCELLAPPGNKIFKLSSL